MPLVTGQRAPSMTPMPRVRRRSARPAFPWIGLLTTLLIVLLGTTGGLLYYLHDLTRSERDICRANMRALAKAEERYRRQSPTHGYTRDLSDLIRHGDIPYVPLCPSGGRYHIIIGPGRTHDGQVVAPGAFAVEDSTVDTHGAYRPGREIP